ncbi:MAG TPA: putative phage abortive infection protein [Cyclobacteriaceae bacterium]|nr:putative phage abortive infection protein [Cyclobacteriaceae bacterium]
MAKRNKLKTFDSTFGWIAFLFFAIIVLFLFFPYLFTQLSCFDWGFSDKPGEIGDAIGGTLGPFVAIAAAILTFLAFWVQYKANEQQKKDLEIERFESKFYSLLELHRNNVNETTIGKTTVGRKAFVSMFNELKFIFYSVEWFFRENYSKKMPDDNVPEHIRYNIAYIIFFFGIGPNSSHIVVDLIGEKYKGFFLSAEEYLKGVQKTWRSERKAKKPIAVDINGTNVFELDLRYKPCNGHMSKLSHYVRHLFQLVKYVHESDNELFSYQDKYDYIANVRSQLSTHEQLLLYYNAISVLGQPWLENPNYLKEYCVIKSIPLSLADFYQKPKSLLGDKNEHGKNLFEWDEIQQRIKGDGK